MDPSEIYAKTELGLQELKDRMLDLPIAMRGLLIQIDGKRTVAEVLAKARMLELDEGKVNVRGGAIAIGHPLGASGARIATTLIHTMVDRDAAFGLATMCIGVGQGIAVIFERV